MKSIDEFFYKTYSEGDYDCLDFSAEVWTFLTGQDLRAALGALLEGAVSRQVRQGHRRHFVALDAPRSPCLAYMSRPRGGPHIGVYLDGSILHIHAGGVEFQPPEVAARAFTKVRYYVPCKE